MFTDESTHTKKPRTFGCVKGLIKMADDFDEPLEDFDSITGGPQRASIGRPMKDDKADWLIFCEAALRVGNFKSFDQIILQALDAWFKQLPSDPRWDIAIELYTNDRISSGKAAEIAGLNYFVFLDELKAHGIQFIAAELVGGEIGEREEALLDEFTAEPKTSPCDSTGVGDIEGDLKAQGWTGHGIFKDDPEALALFDEIEGERNRHWVGGE